ncbi:large ribosomal subunit protein uL22 [Candidatus Shikimatogenerans silvanidophilus]|uniref:large ribosomal subunit protein uL22 n=1 Tax=Candidatus Shikimatogenerans silvanidophilus TaxID=2782547 RepID=UPI001BA84B3E|nr:uL22 family ribosomal protein [Candidatus Shikimatogenerans silvanidophilus]
MGSRKKKKSFIKKEKKKKEVYVKLKNCNISPRKMRLIANIIRGKNIIDSLNILKNIKRYSSIIFEKLLLSLLNNWKIKKKINNFDEIEYSKLYIREILVNESYSLKRLLTAPQGRGNQIKKRFSNIKIKIDL